MHNKPFIAADKNIAELSLRSIILAVILTVLLATSNAYMALKLGILSSASIPAAILSMGILRFFKNSTILENNSVQTAASAGEAVAGGIVYTIPALIIIEYWHGFDYWTNVFIAASGGILGVLFSIPLRKILVHDHKLHFPEGRAIAELLKSSAEKAGFNNILLGGLIGALLELLQMGFKLIAGSWMYCMVLKRTLFIVGAGFSATMIGAGYLVGYDMAISIFLGALISWLIALPVASHVYPEFLANNDAAQALALLWNNELRYLGIGAMLCAGTLTFIKLIKPLLMRICGSFTGDRPRFKPKLARIDQDIPLIFIICGVLIIAYALFLFFHAVFPLAQLGFMGNLSIMLVLAMVAYVIIIGFLFALINSYFSAMVGVTASPGSAVVIAGVLLAAWLLLCIINGIIPLPISHDQIKAAEAITIIIGSVVTGIAAIANDNTQDLKVGQLLGATPWKQQLMLILGVIISALVIPPIMQLLFNVYGIAGVMPHPGMDIAQSLPAPTAALLAAIADAVFRHALPWSMIWVGVSVIFIIMLINRLCKLQNFVQISILGVAIGMYLPLSSSVPLFLGGMIAKFVNRSLQKKFISSIECNKREQIGTLIACGLVAGSALMDVILTIPFSIMQSPDALQLFGVAWQPYSLILALVSTLFLARWMALRVYKDN